MRIENGTLYDVSDSDIRDGQFEIPESVTSIGDSAFFDCHSLTSITIHESVTRIGHYVFAGCISLSSIEISAGVTGIGSNAFYSCRSLTSITIPDSVTRIGSSAFYDCMSLKSIKNNYKAFALTKRGRLYAKAALTLRFNINRKTRCENELEICKSGIHYCTNLFDIFNYYSGEYGKDFVITICDVSDENIGHENDSKRCAKWIIPRKILTRDEVIEILNGGGRTNNANVGMDRKRESDQSSPRSAFSDS